MRSSASARMWPLVVVAAVTLSVGAASALAATASEEQQGAALVKALNAGKRSCSTLSTTDFERIGEYAMGLNFSTVAQHDAMNQHMRGMMGAQGEEQAHHAMGRAYTGCASNGQRGSAYGAGMMGGTGMMGGGSYGSGMMGGSSYGPGMMGGRGPANDHGWGSGAVLLVAVLAAGLGAAVVALVAMRLGRHHPAAGGY